MAEHTPIRKSVALPLTLAEKQLFDILLETVNTKRLGTTLRVAGGWVRDKLLGGNNDDIDIAIDNMSGKEFAEKVNELLQEKQLETHSIGVIKSNPEQSKHLETATTRILGVWVDFVNLRSERYTQHSRIPQIEIGTPYEDSLRRDLTINSLYYNINTNEVEDWTRQGLQDLENKIIRTPLPPFETFMDDPLRVLRVIRFAARFQFTVAPHVFEAITEPVLEALKCKISRERICKELLGMLKGPRPELAITIIRNLKLFDIIFALPSTIDSPVDDFANRGTLYLRQGVRLVRMLGDSEFQLNEDNKRQFYFACILLPTENRTYITPSKKTEPVCDYVMLESLKLTSADTKAVRIMLANVGEFRKILQDNVNGIEFPSRKNLGLLLRKTDTYWLQCIFLSILDALPRFDEEPRQAEVDPSLDHSSLPPMLKSALELQKHIEDLCLIGVWKMKPLLNGEEIMSCLKVTAPGPLVGFVNQVLIEWQLENPQGDRDTCRAWLIENAESLKQQCDNVLRSKRRTNK